MLTLFLLSSFPAYLQNKIIAIMFKARTKCRKLCIYLSLLLSFTHPIIKNDIIMYVVYYFFLFLWWEIFNSNFRVAYYKIIILGRRIVKIRLIFKTALRWNLPQRNEESNKLIGNMRDETSNNLQIEHHHKVASKLRSVITNWMFFFLCYFFNNLTRPSGYLSNWMPDEGQWMLTILYVYFLFSLFGWYIFNLSTIKFCCLKKY